MNRRNPFGITFGVFTRNRDGQAVSYSVRDAWTLETFGWVQRNQHGHDYWEGFVAQPRRFPDAPDLVLRHTRAEVAVALRQWHRHGEILVGKMEPFGNLRPTVRV